MPQPLTVFERDFWYHVGGDMESPLVQRRNLTNIFGRHRKTWPIKLHIYEENKEAVEGALVVFGRNDIEIIVIEPNEIRFSYYIDEADQCSYIYPYDPYSHLAEWSKARDAQVTAYIAYLDSKFKYKTP